MIQVISKELIEQTKQAARNSERKRAIYKFHKETDSLQRMINVLLNGTYVQPHRHANPAKLEHFLILEGEVACVEFKENGSVDTVIWMRPDTTTGVYILPGTIHSLVCISKEAVLSEIIEGAYNPQTHKEFMKFAPQENTPESHQYLNNLYDLIRKDFP